MQAVEKTAAKKANKADLWDKLWSQSSTADWRKHALSSVYQRVSSLIPRGSKVLDLGGGQGDLADVLSKKKCRVTVCDHSSVAVTEAVRRGHNGIRKDINEGLPEVSGGWITATEVFEHFEEPVRSEILSWAVSNAVCSGTGFIVSVPNNRLGPDEEPQHAVKFTAKQFLDVLRSYGDARVEVYGPYLLGIVGPAAKKQVTLSMTLPVRDEARDLEKVLASFRGVADEIVVGVDPRSVDRTREIAEEYADVVFDLTELRGPPEERVPEGGFHFSHARNQCLDRCTSDWIFMTEGHERLISGFDTLLELGSVMPEDAQVGYVWRRGASQQWGYPWLYKRECGFRYERAIHNELRYPADTNVVQLPQVVTLHERSKENAERRAVQRKLQNKTTLYDDWQTNSNTSSLFYFAQELKAEDPQAAIDKFTEFLAVGGTNGLSRYQARLELAKLLIAQGDRDSAREALVPASGDDWSRVEHYLWLGDLAFDEDQYEQALQWYRYASTVCGDPPFSLYWIDIPSYTYLPAQRLAMCYGHLGRLKDALEWAVKVKELLPEEAPEECFEEANNNIELLQEALGEGLS